MKLRLIVNPKAGGGAAGRREPEITRALRRRGLEHDVARTQRAGDAERLVREARADGVDCVALVGGDGTINEASQAYLDVEGRPVPGPDLALIPAGTGGDFRKTFGLPDSFEAAAERLERATARPLDLGILRLTNDAGEPVWRAFLNITSFGLGGLTDRIVNATPKWMGGRVAFFLGALRAMAVYRNAEVVVRVDGERFHQGPILNVAIANGRYFGGGMKVAPDADPSDGRFDLVVLGDFGRLGAIGLSSRIYTGSHVGRPRVQITRARRVEAEAVRPSDRVLIDMDGETPGRLPLTAEVAPGALKIRI